MIYVVNVSGGLTSSFEALRRTPNGTAVQTRERFWWTPSLKMRSYCFSR